MQGVQANHKREPEKESPGMEVKHLNRDRIDAALPSEG